jgi:hypothetical protein
MLMIIAGCDTLTREAEVLAQAVVQEPGSSRDPHVVARRVLGHYRG